METFPPAKPLVLLVVEKILFPAVVIVPPTDTGPFNDVSRTAPPSEPLLVIEPLILRAASLATLTLPANPDVDELFNGPLTDTAAPEPAVGANAANETIAGVLPFLTANPPPMFS
jgi:hypothetical protein